MKQKYKYALKTRLSLLLIASLLMSGCGEEGAIEGAIKENLRDPESGRFEDIYIGSSGTWACAKYKGKNAFGGYGHWKIASLMKNDSGWEAYNMDTTWTTCTLPERLAEILAIQVETDETKKYYDGAIKMIIKAKNLPPETDLYDLPRSCSALASEYNLLKRTENEKSDRLAAAQVKVHTGDC